MAEQVMDGSGLAMPPEGVCIHTNKITDVCLDKDCIEDLRVYLTADSQARLDASAGARVRSVELLWVDIDVEELGFQRGYAAVELTFYYRVRGETGTGTAGALDGVAVFQKRVVLYGGSGAAKIFSSRAAAIQPALLQQPPEAVVEVIDPMVLSSRVMEAGDNAPQELVDIPTQIRGVFPSDLVMDSNIRRMFVTIGQFSTIRLERDAQLSMPGGSYCVPGKSCCGEGSCQEDPCDVFSRIDFPYQAFYPEQTEEGQ